MLGEELHPKLWASYLNFTKPEIVSELHNSYLNAGADIITTNTFRTNPVAVDSSGLTIDKVKFVESSVELAKRNIYDGKVLIAGSNAPAEDCYQKKRTISRQELIDNHQTHISLLYEFGSDFILNETQSHFDEIEIICEFCAKENFPFVISIYFTNDGRILSGEKLDVLLDFVVKYSPIAVGLNCISFQTLQKILPELKMNYNFGFYCNVCKPASVSKKMSVDLSPQNYLEQIKPNITEKTKFIGSCCGSSPAYTKVLKDYFNAKN